MNVLIINEWIDYALRMEKEMDGWIVNACGMDG